MNSREPADTKTPKPAFDPLDLRRKLIRLAEPGDSVEFAGPFDLIDAEVRRFSRGRGIPFDIEQADGGARITRKQKKPKGMHAYPEIAELKPGESVLLDVPPISHQRVRVTASQTALKTGATFRCMREGDAIRVIRTDGIDSRAAAALPARPTKYDLDRLATGARLTFDVAPADQFKLRSACSFKAKQTGWAIRCRLQDDGTMLVYRTDAPTPAPAPTPTTD